MNEAIIAAAVSGAVLFLGKVVDWIIALAKAKREGKTQEKKDDVEVKKQEVELEKTEADHAVSLYREHIADLKKDVKSLLASLHNVEKENLECREDRAALRVEVKNLTSQVAQLKGKTE